MSARIRPAWGLLTARERSASRRRLRPACLLPWALLSATAAATLGCETGSAPSEPVAPAPARQPVATTSQPSRSDRPAPDAVVSEVEWPARERIDEAARAALDPAARDAVDQAAVPVLVPTGAEWLTRGKLMNGEHWFAYAASGDGLSLSIQGTRLAHRHQAVAPAKGNRQVRGTAAFVGENRRIWTVSWFEQGAAYALDLECAAADDRRCADERATTAFAEGLRFVGGRGTLAAGGAR